MSNQLIIQAALQLVQTLIGAALAFGQATGVPADKLDEALRKEIEKFEQNDPSQLKG